MTLVGKIFTMLIFIMSLVFMTFAVMVFATHKNWKEVAIAPTTGLKAQLTAAYEAKRGLEVELERLRTQLAEHQAARVQALATLQVSVTDATSRLEKTSADLAKLQADQSATVQALEVAEQNLEKTTTEVGQLRDNIVTVQQDRDNKLDRVVSLSDLNNQATAKLVQLEERKQQLISQVAAQKSVMEKFNITVNTPIEAIPPAIDGVVLAVSDKDLVEVSIGLDDGLREGHKLEIYRGNQYVGRMNVRKVTANRAVGEIDPKLKQGPVRKGDRVATNIR